VHNQKGLTKFDYLEQRIVKEAKKRDIRLRKFKQRTQVLKEGLRVKRIEEKLEELEKADNKLKYATNSRKASFEKLSEEHRRYHEAKRQVTKQLEYLEQTKKGKILIDLEEYKQQHSQELEKYNKELEELLENTGSGTI